MTLNCQRHLFDIPDDVIYLNCAAQSPCLTKSAMDGRKALGRKLQPWNPERQNVETEMEDCRSLFGQLIGGSKDDVAITFSTSYAVATAAKNLSLKKGQEIIVLEGQFPSNYYAWSRLVERDNGKMRIIPWPHDFDWTSRVLEALNSNIGIVALPNCHWMDGSLVDLNKVGLECKKRGIPMVVDATQSIGAFNTDVGLMQADYVIASSYKWLLGPDMMGFMYVSPECQNGTPIEDNHSTRENEKSMKSSAGYSDNYRKGARRFDMGAANSMIHLPMTKSALEQVNYWTVAEIQSTLEILVNRIADAASSIGFTVAPKCHRAGHFLGLWPQRNLPENLLQRLEEKNIFISLRGGALRVSPYLFNDLADVDKFLEILDYEISRV